MQIKLNDIIFEVSPVTTALRNVLLTDPIIVQGVWRDVYHWDATAQVGKVLVTTTPSGTAPLGNGINFFVAKPGEALVKSESASARMAERFLEALKAKSIIDVVRAFNSIVNLAQKSIPLANYTALNPVASYTIKMHVDYAAIELRNAGRNLTAYAYVPGQVAFHHEISAITDQAGYEALPAPSMAQVMPAFIVPPQNKANHAIRRLALAQRLGDMQPAIKALPEGPQDMATEGLRRSYARLVAEWKALTEAPKTPVKAPFIA
jgi:hypothetical protein